MRVAIGTKWASESNTGVGVYTRELVRALVAEGQGNSLRVSLLRRRGTRRLSRQECDEISYRALPGPLWILSQNRAFERVANSFDVLHEPFLGIAKKMDTPTVVTIHDIIPRLFPHLVPRSFRFYFDHVLPLVFDNVDAVIVDSETTSEDLMKSYGVSRSKIHVVHLGSDHIPEGGHFDGPPVHARRVPRGGFMLVVGTGPSKQVHVAIEAFSQALEFLPPSMELRVVGSLGKTAKEALRANPSVSKRLVTFQNLSRERLAALYREADAVVHPALYEGFGLVPLEAMRAGVPVISTDGGALAEVCGDVALRVPVGCPDQMAKAMVDVMDPETRARVVAAGHRLARKFSWAKTARETIRVYRRVAGEEVEDWSEPLRQSAALVSA